MALQRLKRQRKTPTAWFSCSRIFVFTKTCKLSTRRWFLCMAGVLESHHCSQRVAASRKKDSHFWNCVRNLTWPTLTDIEHTSKGSLFTVNKSCEETFGLFHRHAKVIGYVNAIMLAVKWPFAPLWSHQFHRNACCSPKIQNSNTQMWQERKGHKHQREPHKVGHIISQRKPSIYLLCYICCIRS